MGGLLWHIHPRTVGGIMTPVISVCCVTYNHEKYIREAIEGFLRQQTTYPMEIIIHDDCSTDGTVNIVREYEKKYSDVIRGIYQKENQKSRGKNIFPFVFKEVRGKYIALCEGDDSWTNSSKLQKQIEFLEKNDEFVISTHAVQCINDSNEIEGKWFEPPEIKGHYTLEDFISYGRTFIATSSLVSRNYFNKLHEWYYDTPAGDMALIMSMCLQGNGKIKRFHEVMSVHRRHEGGVYSRLSLLEKHMFSIEARIFFRTKLPQEYEPAFKQGLKRIIAEITSGAQNPAPGPPTKLASPVPEVVAPPSPPAHSTAGWLEGLRYRSYGDLSLTVNRNLAKIPRDIDLVVGIPRSGMMPATMVGQILNKPVVTLDAFLSGMVSDMGLYRRPKKHIADIAQMDRVLIIDDSINSGGSMAKVKERVAAADHDNIHPIYCAVYYVPGSLSKVDIGLEECPWPRIFQWNILNSWILGCACVDIDGVVCVDPTEDENDDGERYRHFLLNARPLFLTDFPISCFVTSRLEKYRALTQEWMRCHEINFNDLVMLNLPSKEERIKLNIHARFKAEVYRNRKEELFIESNWGQAREIAQLTGKRVFCTQNMEMIEPISTNPLQRSVPALQSGQEKIPFAEKVPLETAPRGLGNGEKLADRKKMPEVFPLKKSVLLVNHDLHPYEISGTPISTLNHALGLAEKGMNVAVLITTPEIKSGFEKIVKDQYTVYRMPRHDKYKVFFGDLEPEFRGDILGSLQAMISEFRPDIVHINDYVYLPGEIIALFHGQGLQVIRNVCNMEEICHLDYPVIAKGLQGELCCGPDSPLKCAECYFLNKLGLNRQEIDDQQLRSVAAKIEKRTASIKKLYEEDVDGVIFTTAAFKDYFCRYIAVAENRIEVIPRGFKNACKQTVMPKKRVLGKVRFAYMGHMMFSKGTDVLLKAFEENAALDSFHLDLYGGIVDAAYGDWIVALEETYPRKIKYHGVYKESDLEKIACNTDVAIIPSYFDTYNRVVRELLCLGVPLIVTDFFGSAIVEDGINGLKIKVGNHQELAAAMQKIAGDPRLVVRLAEGAVKTKIPSLSDETIGLMNCYVRNINLSEKGGGQLEKSPESPARLIAFNLPQFHPIPENDHWWGTGFTEWTNVAKGKPLYPGHYQPHIPADLGFYDLRLSESREAQADLAREYGIEGFCYWHYWFNGKRLLERPFQEVLKSGKPDFPFCLAWANENWTRRWDGWTEDILMEQAYGGELDDQAHFEFLLPALKDPRAIRIDSKPVFLIYRPAHLPNAEGTLRLWRELAEQAGLPGLYLIGIRTHFESDALDYRELGFDGQLFFQPDFSSMEAIPAESYPETEASETKVIRYAEACRRFQHRFEPFAQDPHNFPCVTPGWDNSPRRKKGAIVLHESDPQSYGEWLQLEINRMGERTTEHKLVFINAWNEWAEGNHLEPDLKHGHQFLQATRDAHLGITLAKGGEKVPAPNQIIPSLHPKTFSQILIESHEHLEAKEYGAALEQLELASKQKQNYQGVHLLRAKAFIGMDRWVEALVALNKELAAHPGHPDALELKNHVIEKTRSPEIISESTRQGQALSLCEEGRDLLERKEYQEALLRLDSAAEIQERILGCQYARALCLQALNRLPEAELAVRSELQLQPHFKEAQVLFHSLRKASSAAIQCKTGPEFKCDQFENGEAFSRLRGEGTPSRNEETSVERSLLPASQQPFTVDGVCSLCQKPVAFKADFTLQERYGDILVPNWRETLHCPLCHVGNRIRAAIHLVLSEFQLGVKSTLYVTEQTGSFYNWMRERFPLLVGSEYLGDSVPFGSENAMHLRNEDLTKLTFAENSLDYVFSFDVLEHVPDFKKGLAECRRVLKPGGILFFSAPFYPHLPKNQSIAHMDADGTIHCNGNPVYHFNPIDPKGSLVFTHFGWELLENVRLVGFLNVRAYRCWSRDYGYLGDKVIFICGRKPCHDSPESLATTRPGAVSLPEENPDSNETEKSRSEAGSKLQTEAHEVATQMPESHSTQPPKTNSSRFQAVWERRPDYTWQFEILVSLLYHKIVQPADIIMDGGANSGLHAVPLARLLKGKGHLYCVEPNPSIVEHLAQNLSRDGVLNVCSIHAQALSHSSGFVEFIVNDEDPALSHIRHETESKLRSIRVPTDTIDEITKNNPVAFVKLDLEGADFLALQGAKSMMQRCKPIVIFENSRAGAAKSYSYTRDDFTKFFQNLNYQVFDLHAVELTGANWEDPDLTWEYICGPRNDERLKTALGYIQRFWGTVDFRPILQAWAECVHGVLSPIEYLESSGFTKGC
jgi:FkbM family methyltransferase